MQKRITKGMKAFSMYGDFHKIFVSILEFSEIYKDVEEFNTAKLILGAMSDLSTIEREEMLQIFKDYYILTQKIGIVEDNEDYWKQVEGLCKEFGYKYKNQEYSKKLALLLIEEKEKEFKKRFGGE